MSLHRSVRRLVLTTLALLTASATLLWHPAAADEKPAPHKELAKPGVLFTLPDDPKKTPDDLKALQGTWQAISLEHNGEKSCAEAVKNFRVVIKDNAITFESDGHKREATFLLLTATRPKAIWLKAQPKDPVVRAIYELVGNHLTICVDNDKGTAMPTEFTAKAESGLTLMVLERAPPPKKVGDASNLKEKRYAFSFKNRKWSEVFEWLTDQTEMPFIGTHVPVGRFSFNPPDWKTFTLSEIVDIINDALRPEGTNKGEFQFLRRQRCFTLIPLDRKVDQALTRLVDLEDLESLGRTEIVRIQMLVRGTSVVHIAPILEKMLSNHGCALALEDNNVLILSDTAWSAPRKLVQGIW